MIDANKKLFPEIQQQSILDISRITKFKQTAMNINVDVTLFFITLLVRKNSNFLRYK